MQNREPCENCGKLVAPFQSVSLGSENGKYRHLCMACSNAEIAALSGIDFEHPNYLPVTYPDFDGIEHEFHFNTRLLGDRVAISALEVKDGEHRGYKFEVLGYDPEGDTFELYNQLLDKTRRGLMQRHIKTDRCGLQIAKPDIVRARIDYDLENPDGGPLLIIDGKEVPWDEFGRMLTTFEGFQFRMEIYDMSEER